MKHVFLFAAGILLLFALPARADVLIYNCPTIPPSEGHAARQSAGEPGQDRRASRTRWGRCTSAWTK